MPLLLAIEAGILFIERGFVLRDKKIRAKSATRRGTAKKNDIFIGNIAIFNTYCENKITIHISHYILWFQALC